MVHRRVDVLYTLDMIDMFLADQNLNFYAVSAVKAMRTVAVRKQEYLHQDNVQQHSLHGIEAAVATEVLVVDDTKVDGKEYSKTA